MKKTLIVFCMSLAFLTACSESDSNGGVTQPSTGTITPNASKCDMATQKLPASSLAWQPTFGGGCEVTQLFALNELEKFDTLSVVLLSAALYLDTVGAYVVLISLFKLLTNMSRDVVFDRANTKLMKIIMGALTAIGVVCGAAGFVWFGSFFLLFAMLFVALIVASVEVVFAKAISMKEEMDLTI